jgi:hypothetical protein
MKERVYWSRDVYLMKTRRRESNRKGLGTRYP